MSKIAEHKKNAAKYAVENFVKSDMILGLGTGSTSIFAIKKIAELYENEHLKNILGIPSSDQIESLARELGIPLTSLNENNIIDVTIDGADEVDPDLNLIKGGGRALLREKIVAQASKREIIIVDESKLSEKLGTTWPVPIEVIRFGWESQAAYLASIGGEPKLRSEESGEPIITDEGNFILDVNFGVIDDVKALAKKLEGRAGIVEHGLFIQLATDLVVAGEPGIQHIEK